MKKIFIIISLWAFLVLQGCAAVKTAERSEPPQLLYIEGTVQEVAGHDVTLLLKLPEGEKASGAPIREIARQVIQKSILIEGITTDLDGRTAVVKEVRGNTVRLTMTKPAIYTGGAVVKLKIPKKTIAVVDFEVIRGKEQEIGRVTMEDLTAALIESGHFVVVERSKLKAIMEELQLSKSGLTRNTPEQLLGKLHLAELLLTGTLSEQRGEWNINLRLVNVSTGQAVAAISTRTTLFKPSELRDSGQLPGDFEEAFLDPSWLAIRAGSRFFYDAAVDTTTGAEGSKKSMRIDFHLKKGENPLMARVENRKKRDLTLYDGIEFYARATERLRIMAMILTSQPDDPNRIDGWMGMATVDREWERFRIPFQSMVIARGWIKQGSAAYGSQAGDQVLRLNRVEDIRIGVHQGHNRDNLQGTIWLDRIRFYRD